MLKNDRAILEFLGKQGKPTGTKTIMTGTNLNYQSVLRSVKRLHGLGVLGASYGPGRSLLYTVRLDQPVEEPELEPTEHMKRTRPADLYSALKVFQVHKLPKFVETGSYKAYARAVAGLFGHAVEVGYGAAPDRSELLHYRQDLVAYKEEIENHLRGIQAILDTHELWNERSNLTYLMQMHDFDLADISDKVNQAREANK